MQEISKYQQFKIERLSRKTFKNAEYNPRKITEKNRKKLKKVIEEKGLVLPILINKRTNNIVGGHQRITALDTLHKTDDYFLDVAVVDIDEKEEVKLNIILNNREIQGDYDYLKIGEMIEEYEIDINEVYFEPEIIEEVMIENLSREESDENLEEKSRRLKEIGNAVTDKEKRDERDKVKLENMSEEEKKLLEERKKAMYEKIDQSRKDFKDKDEEKNLRNFFRTLIVKFDNPDEMVDFLERNNLDLQTKTIFFNELCNLEL